MSIRCLFFDVGYTLVNEDAVWEARCREQADMPEARALGLSAGLRCVAVSCVTVERVEVSLSCDGLGCVASEVSYLTIDDDVVALLQQVAAGVLLVTQVEGTVDGEGSAGGGAVVADVIGEGRVPQADGRLVGQAAQRLRVFRGHGRLIGVLVRLQGEAHVEAHHADQRIDHDGPDQRLAGGDLSAEMDAEIKAYQEKAF